jgi:Spy/CpxP family protein refolding chaperone
MAWAVLAVCLGLAVNVAAQAPVGAGPVGQRGPGGPPPGGPGGPGGLPPLFMRIALTEAQQTQIKALLDEQREARRTDMDERRTLQEQLASAIYGSTADVDGVQQIVTRLSELQKAALEADVALQTKVATLLTEEQRQQVIAQASLRPGPPGAGPRTR